MPRTPRPSVEPSLAVAVLWLFLAAGAIVMFLGGIHFLFGAGETDPLPAPTQTVTVVETPSRTPLPTPLTPDEWPTEDPCATPTSWHWNPCPGEEGYVAPTGP